MNEVSRQCEFTLGGRVAIRPPRALPELVRGARASAPHLRTDAWLVSRRLSVRGDVALHGESRGSNARK